MLNEEVARETINAVAGPAKQAAYYFVRKAVQLNEKELAKFIQQMKTAPEKVMEKLNGTGKEMSVKEILKKDEGAKNIDISELGIGDFKPIARRYGMDFAVVKSRYQDPPKYTVFFKAKDADTIEKVMNEYSAKCIKKEKEVGRKKPSLLAALKKLLAHRSRGKKSRKGRRRCDEHYRNTFAQRLPAMQEGRRLIERQ